MKLKIHESRDIEKQIKKIANIFLMPYYHKVKKAIKKDGSLVSEADYEVQNQVQMFLLKRFPNIPILGEEMTKTQQIEILNKSDLFWCLDPIDGTSNFLSGLPYFSISLALFSGGKVVAGIVYDPERDESFSAIEGQGAWLNSKKLKLNVNETKMKNLIAIADFKKMSPTLATNLVKAPPYASQRSLGSIALDWCWLAAGRAHIYIHSRHTVWDFAAGLLIFSEAGGIASRIDQAELNHFTLEKQVAIAATSVSLFSQWNNWIENNS